MTRLGQLGRLWRTVRHLKARQVAGRVAFKLARPAPDLRAAPARRASAGAWVAPAMREPSLTGPGRFRFLNFEGDLATLGWCGPQAEKLWRYNQHYFDDLNAHGAAARRAWHVELASRWVAENAPAAGDGWEPYPTSLRIVNWVKWFVGGVPARPEWAQSLAVQARWLRRRLEWHLLGNHLFANAKALVFAGLWFEGAEADEWLAVGLRILAREVPEQILPDGGQFERSPMYHALALEDMLDLVNVVRVLAPAGAAARARLPDWQGRAAAMLHWLCCMSHPDGGIAFFNDAALGIAPCNAELERYAAALGIAVEPAPAEGVTRLEESGYVRMARGDAVALLDVAPVGPDYLPGHAHADTLSFELSLRGRRVVVNGGTSCYGLGAQRLRERGTAAHSTLQIDGHDSSEVWSGFRVGRRARPFGVRVEGWEAEASHDGYRHLPGGPVHRRRWRLDAAVLVVDDAVSPPGPLTADAVARYHLGPGLRLQAVGPTRWQVLEGGREIAVVDVLAGAGQAVPSQHAPEFGRLIATQALAVRLSGGRAVTRWSWGADAHPVSE